MAIITTPTVSQATSAATTTSKPSYNWAQVQLNLVMLPVGLSLLLILGLTVVFCHCLRKRRLKRLTKDAKRQQKSKEAYTLQFNETNKAVNFASSHHNLPNRCNSTLSKAETFVSPTHPATLRKEKIKRKAANRSSDAGSMSSEKRRKNSRRSVTPSSERPRSRDINSNGKVLRGRKKSGIPVPVKAIKREKRKHSVEKKRDVDKSSRPETSIAIIDRGDPYRIDMDTVRSSRDRRKWEIPQPQQIEYDLNGGLRLPPLLETRLAKTA